MKRLHLAISINDLETSIQDYSKRLGSSPQVVIPGEYALWRTESVNLSIRKDPNVKPGSLRHLGWEDDSAEEFSSDTDCNGILWEHFAFNHQKQEILDVWPDSKFDD